MGIGEQFAGLDMGNLIGGPLTAAADASIMLAKSTADFINTVGFDAEQKVRTAGFSFQRMEPDADGSINQSEMKVDVPLLAIVPIPNLQIDEVNILFDMEVKQCEKSEQSLDLGAKISGSANIGPVKVSISGSVSSHSSNTRSSDNSAKYHVDVSATNHGTPEGLARVLDMMAANVAPTLVSSRAVDESGKELSGARRARNLKLRESRDKLSLSKQTADAAEENYNDSIKKLINESTSYENEKRLQQELLQRKEDEHTIVESEKATLEYLKEKENEISDGWDAFRSSIKQRVETVYKNALNESGELTEEALATLLSMCPKYKAEDDKADIKARLEPYFKKSITVCKNHMKAQSRMDENKASYHNALQGQEEQ